jgi:leader peptidase (prepilin peptidase) / N-methyltransferase
MPLEPSLLYYVTVALLGLVVGSFLNVVIHRLPRMLERRWQAECRELNGTETPVVEQTPYNLVVPGSNCPACSHKIRPWENIPLLSYLLLRGRCSACGVHISVRYPLIELVAGLAALAVAWHYGPGWQTAAALVFTWALLALTMIDLETQLLPDSITLPLLWLGLLVNLKGMFVPLYSAVIGAATGYLALWAVYHTFRLLTGKEGMGYGDFKLLAALGAWFGWQMLPLTILLSSLVGAVIGLGLMAFRNHAREVPIPFGPYLAVAGWIALLWGTSLTEAYLRFAHLG